MPNEEIIIDIAPNGDVRIEANNVVGPECESLTADIEEALGVVTARKHKPEFHRKQAERRREKA